MGDQMTVQAGSDATRLNLDPAEESARRRKQAVARGNLAALMCERYGVDPTVQPHPATLAEQLAAREFAALGDILGLNGDGEERSAGTCSSCGNPIPMSALNRSFSGRGGGPSGGYRLGQCWWCSNGVDRPDQAGPAVRRTSTSQTAAAVATSYRGGTGHCPECGRGYHLNGLGQLRTHLAWENRDGVQVRLTTPCPGGGALARELADVAHLTETEASHA